MPILICLKSPRINLVAEGTISDRDEKAWDTIFHNQVLIFKSNKGKNTLVPLLQECNIAVMEEMTDKEVKEMEERQKKKQEEGKGEGSLLTKPEMVFPVGKRGRS